MSRSLLPVLNFNFTPSFSSFFENPEYFCSNKFCSVQLINSSSFISLCVSHICNFQLFHLYVLHYSCYPSGLVASFITVTDLIEPVSIKTPLLYFPNFLYLESFILRCQQCFNFLLCLFTINSFILGNPIPLSLHFLNNFFFAYSRSTDLDLWEYFLFI